VNEKEIATMLVSDMEGILAFIAVEDNNKEGTTHGIIKLGTGGGTGIHFEQKDGQKVSCCGRTFFEAAWFFNFLYSHSFRGLTHTFFVPCLIILKRPLSVLLLTSYHLHLLVVSTPSNRMRAVAAVVAFSIQILRRMRTPKGRRIVEKKVLMSHQV
jgi:hypothetical protein